MGLIDEMSGALLENGVAEITLRGLIFHIIFAVILIVLGYGLGKIAERILKKMVEELRAGNIISYSFANVAISAIKWAIYVFFINMALIQLGIPGVTSWLTSILAVFPALIASLVLIVIGFSIATYLKNRVEETKVENHELLSRIMYYFVLYVFVLFAIKSALISQDVFITNILIIVYTMIASVLILFRHYRF